MKYQHQDNLKTCQCEGLCGTESSQAHQWYNKEKNEQIRTPIVRKDENIGLIYRYLDFTDISEIYRWIFLHEYQYIGN